MDLFSSACPQGAPDVQDGAELGRAQRALALVLAQAARVEGVAAQKVHRRQLQGPPAERAPVVLEHAHLQNCFTRQHVPDNLSSAAKLRLHRWGSNVRRRASHLGGLGQLCLQLHVHALQAFALSLPAPQAAGALLL